MRLKNKLVGAVACIVPMSVSAQTVGVGYSPAPASGFVEAAPLAAPSSLGAETFSPETSMKLGLEGSIVTTVDDLSVAAPAASVSRSLPQSQTRTALTIPPAASVRFGAHGASPLTEAAQRFSRPEGATVGNLSSYFDHTRSLNAAVETEDSLGVPAVQVSAERPALVTTLSNAAVHATGAEGGLFSRMAAVIRSWFGWGVRSAENPELLLRQYMDDVKVNGTKMNEAVVAVEKTKILLEGQIAQHKKEIAEQDAQIKTAVKLGPSYEEHAKQIIAAKMTAQKSLEDTQAQLDMQMTALKHAKEARDAYKARMEQRSREAMALIAKDKQAKANETLANIMSDAFNTGDDHSDVFNRMKDKIDERSAEAQARMNNSRSDADQKMDEIKKATVGMGVEDELAKYKAEAGSGIAAASADAVKKAGAEAKGLLRRMWDVIRSWFGWGVRSAENPELLLRQYMDDIKVNGTKMNEAVVAVEKTKILLEGQIAQHQKEIAEMDGQIRTAVKLGPSYEEHAKQIIAAKMTAQKSLEDTQVQLDTQIQALKKAKEARDAYKAKMEQRSREAMALIAKDKQAKANETLANIMSDAFNTGDDHSDVFNRMKDKVDERAAEAQARLNNSRTDADQKMDEIKKATIGMGVEDELAKYKAQAGQGGEAPKP